MTLRVLHTPYGTVSFRMTLPDPEWLSKIFNDTKRRAVCLRVARSVCDSCASCNTGTTSTRAAGNDDDDVDHCLKAMQMWHYVVVLHTTATFIDVDSNRRRTRLPSKKVLRVFTGGADGIRERRRGGKMQLFTSMSPFDLPGNCQSVTTVDSYRNLYERRRHDQRHYGRCHA